jgi:uncharacterized protein (DUF2236 family)
MSQYPGVSNPADTVIRRLKSAIAAEVVAIFSDKSRGEKPVTRRPDGLFGKSAVAWRVHGDVTTMMTGGITSLLLQMLHPAVLAGVWDHSNFRSDMSGRLRRTARFIALTTYGSAEEANSIIARVNAIHARVSGTLPDGAPYHARDPKLLAWVHVTEASSFLAAYIRYAEPRMSSAEQNRYFAEMAQIAAALGADPIPETRAAATALVNAMRPELRADARTREVAKIVLTQPARHRLAEPLQRITMQAAIGLLPPWARQMHNLPKTPLLARPIVEGGTQTIAQTLRWVFS